MISTYPSKLVGDYSERVFDIHCLRHGVFPAEPLGDSKPYDRIVEVDGVLSRVQIKSSATPRKNFTYSFLAAKGTGEKCRYTNREVDVLSLYIIPYDLFYNIPFSELSSMRVYVRPAEPEKDRFLKYKDNWDVFNRT